MKLYLVRHGITDWNARKKIQGQVDIPLNEDRKRPGEKDGGRFKGCAV